MLAPRPGARAVLLALALLTLLATPALAAKDSPKVPSVIYPGSTEQLEYKFGPVKVTPGQNTIELRGNDLNKPQVPGYITRFEPDLVYTDGRGVPAVDVIHLHHGVWAIGDDGGFPYPTFAAGEEKTIFQMPRGYGYEHDLKDNWVMNYMIHNLTPNEDEVYITYKIEFVPKTAPAAAEITPAKVLWMDVAGLSLYPVFDVKKGDGKKGRYTFPQDARGKERRKIGAMHQHTFDRDVTLIGTAGHLHPGGLHTDLELDRPGQPKDKLLFRSEAEYWEPAGAVSWDVAMTATKADWRPQVKAGDRLHISATYDSKRASWYESMGIMVLFYAEGHTADSKDPFAGVETRGEVTHGHLAENDNHGGTMTILPDARRMLDGPKANGGDVMIRNFFYGKGDLNNNQRPPVVPRGKSITFNNLIDNKKKIWHTITACKAPCNKETGIAYPLADAEVGFDSAELGTDPGALGTAASGEVRWSTPKDLKPGTYTYFCRVHPFMRGAFRVAGGRGGKKVAGAGRRR